MVFQRIRRVGIDTMTNFTLQRTTTYDATDPADSPAGWGTPLEREAMDQPLTSAVPPAIEVTTLGALVTFDRTPFKFDGAVVKIRASYAGAEASFLEMWTQDSTTLVWTRRRRIGLSDPITGAPSGEAKFHLLFTSASLDDVAAVWLTMDPGSVGSPTMRWVAVHLFGRCDTTIVIPPCPPGEECEPLPPDPTIDEPPTIVFPPFPNPWGPWPSFCDDYPELCADGKPPPELDLCDPESVAAFRVLLTPEQEDVLDELLASIDLPCESELDSGEPTPNIVGEPDEPALLLPKQPGERPLDPDGTWGFDDDLTLDFWPWFIFGSDAAKTVFLDHITAGDIPNADGWKDFVDFWFAAAPSRFVVVPATALATDPNTLRFRLADDQPAGSFAALRVVLTTSTGPSAPFSLDAVPTLGAPGTRGSAAVNGSPDFNAYQTVGGYAAHAFGSFSTPTFLTSGWGALPDAKAPGVVPPTKSPDSDWWAHAAGNPGPLRQFSLWRKPGRSWDDQGFVNTAVVMVAIVATSPGVTAPSLVVETNL